MTRSLAALACFAALFGAPAKSQAGPWMYEDSFYGPSWGGYGYGWGTGYRGYTTGYAPFYSGYVASYAPAYGYGGSCCSPCGTNSCNPCGTGCGSACGSPCGTGCGTSCDPGCGNCAGGNCATGSGSNPVGSTPADSGTGANPTYAPETNTPKAAPEDQFGPARNRSNPGTQGAGSTGSGATGPGTSIPGGNFGTPAGANTDPNNAAPFAPGNPSTPPRPNRTNEDMGRAPKSLEPGDKVAFKTAARFTRSTLQPAFELPAIVSAPPSTRPDATPAAPTAVASK